MLPPDIVNLLFAVLNDNVWFPPAELISLATEEENAVNPVVDDKVTCDEPLKRPVSSKSNVFALPKNCDAVTADALILPLVTN